MDYESWSGSDFPTGSDQRKWRGGLSNECVVYLLEKSLSWVEWTRGGGSCVLKVYSGPANVEAEEEVRGGGSGYGRSPIPRISWW